MPSVLRNGNTNTADFRNAKEGVPCKGRKVTKLHPPDYAQGGAGIMADSAVEIKRSVLIVDRSPESREVLRTVLARRGVQILEASGARAGLELCRRHHPEVVVLDLDSQAAGDETVQGEYQSQADSDSASLVMLGQANRIDAASAVPAPHGRFVSKPYHYAPLIRTIEELLESAGKSS